MDAIRPPQQIALTLNRQMREVLERVRVQRVFNMLCARAAHARQILIKLITPCAKPSIFAAPVTPTCSMPAIQLTRNLRRSSLKCPTEHAGFCRDRFFATGITTRRATKKFSGSRSRV